MDKAANKIIGRAIARMRNLRHIKQVELAATTGLNQMYISRIENGIQTLSLPRLYVLLEGMDSNIITFERNRSVIANTIDISPMPEWSGTKYE